VKAAVVERPGKIRIWDIKGPEIGDYEALVRMKACGLCNSTDTKIYHGHFPGVTRYPLVLGHEGVGEVVEVGTKVKSFKPGDVILELWGKITDEGLGVGWGAFVEYGVVPDTVALEEDGLPWNPVSLRSQIVPKEIDPLEAVILITLKEALSGLRNFGLQEGMSLLVFGDGPVGGALVRFARLRGAGIVACVGHWDERLRLIRRLGADCVVNEKKEDLKDAIQTAFGDLKFDLVIDAVGRNQIVNHAFTFVRPGGKIGMYGVAAEPDYTLPLAPWPNNVSLHKLFFPYKHEAVHQDVIEYVRNGDIRLKDFYSHVVPLDEIQRGIQLIESREAFRVIVKIS